MRFDTHLHLWRPGDGAAIRIRERLPALDRDFSLGTVRPALAAAEVGRVVLVSAAQQAAETDRLLAVAAANRDLVAGVVGWLDLEAPDLDERIARYASFRAWLGARLPLTVLADRGWILRPAVRAGLERLCAAGAVVEVLAAPDQLERVAETLEALPGLCAVLDHCGTPDFAAAPSAVWREGITRLARRPDTICKVSCFWAPGDPPATVERALPFFSQVLSAFGPERMVAAANWPVSSLAGPYKASWLLLERLTRAAGLSGAEAETLMFGTARRLLDRDRNTLEVSLADGGR